MFSVKGGSFIQAPLEKFATSSYQPFFVRDSRMFPNIFSSQWCSTSREAKPVQSTKENIEATIKPEAISLTGIESLLLDDYPDPVSPDGSDSDDDKLYIDLDPPTNFRRRVSVNCFTSPLKKIAEKNEPVGPDQILSVSGLTLGTEKNKDAPKEKTLGKPTEKPIEKSKVKSKEKSKEKCVGKSRGRGSHSERGDLDKEKKCHESKRRKRRTFENKSSQTDLEYIIPANISSLIAQVNSEPVKEVLQLHCRSVGDHGRKKRARSRVGVRDRMWSGMDEPPFESICTDLCYMRPGEEAPGKRQRGPRQEDDSDMDPPIRTFI